MNNLSEHILTQKQLNFQKNLLVSITKVQYIFLFCLKHTLFFVKVDTIYDSFTKELQVVQVLLTQEAIIMMIPRHIGIRNA